ncbi:laccase-15-like [Salvia miltiorrhiza]|uniref:laccase-15-like n=1 Tax=Salvia miltiorrhiza TaxID=226208 RepID=UPI0025AC3D78|nr:laccase-15-like [Salvia miltiorrhiza]
MGSTKTTRILHFLAFFLLAGVISIHAKTHHQTFVVSDAPYSRLCSNKSILTVNGKFPGPTVRVTEGDTIAIVVVNRARENITIHWHGVKQPRYPWSDGPEYITQCPIQPGSNFSQKIVLSDEIGTMWWHAHSDWSRATVHGALIVYPLIQNDYPFPVPDEEVPIILGEWWKSDVQAVLTEFLQTGGDPNISDAFLINGQPGDLYDLPCSTKDTFKLSVDHGKRYLIRMVNAVMNTIMFFKIAGHNVTIVGSDGAYLKPFTSDYIAISPGQTIDFLLLADQNPSHYYMASRAYAVAGDFDNTTTSARVEYSGNYTPPASPLLPTLPDFTDTAASVNFTARFRSLAYKNHPIQVPLNVTTNLLFTLSINTRNCPNADCLGPQGDRLLASVNNITFQSPRIAILQAYYERISGVYTANFPSDPPFPFNYTSDSVPRALWEPRNGTRVRVLDYNSTVELVFQGTSTVDSPIDHPMHLHGHSFYVVGWGFGNFNSTRDPPNYNLVDPPLQNTIAVPRAGWTAIRFQANNPGVWLMHCHFERHISWGMEMVFITRNGKGTNETMLPPPSDFPMC